MSTKHDDYVLQYPPHYDEDPPEDEVDDHIRRVALFRIGKPGELVRVQGDDDMPNLIVSPDVCITTFRIANLKHGGALHGMVDDEGLLKGLPINWTRHDGSTIHGDMIVFRTNSAGETVDLTDEDFRQLREAIR